jgi:hypothetical protein
MLLVTLHGSKNDNRPHVNNVHAYDKDGNRLSSAVLDDGANVTLSELRGIYQIGKYLYVANANQEQNSILCYEGAGTQYKFVSTFASQKTCNGISHPFDLAFDGKDYMYVSSQDTNVVTRLIITQDGKVGKPAPVAAALQQPGNYLAGTFVGSHNGFLSKPGTTAVPAPGGLEFSAGIAPSYKKHSVRGLVWAGGHLYVVDQPASRIKVYDITGKFTGQSNVVDRPVHLLVRNHVLYVSGGNDVYSAQLPDKPGDFMLTEIKSIKVKNGSGMAFGNAGNFYLASRTENVIHKFDTAFKPMKFNCEVPENPEFLLHV